MKNVFKSLGIFLAFFFLGINSLYAQCILFPGNLVFSGVNLDDDGVDGTSGNDRFSFVLLQDVSENFEIYFTDLGWTTSNSFQSTTKALTDGIIKWTAPVGGVEAGTQITIDAKYALAATLGTVSGVRATPNNPDLYLDLGISGDQLFAFTGTVNSPTFIAGINLNQSWTSLLADRLTSSESFLPVALNAANVQNVSLVSSIDNGFSNAVISSNSFSGLFSNIVAVFNQNTNWVFEDSYQPDAVPSGFQLPKALNFVITPFNFLNNPTGVNTITYGGNTQFTVTKIDSRTIGSYQWQVSSNEGTDYVALTNAGIYSGTATSTLVITKPPVSHNSYRYRVVAMDACGNEAISNHIQLSVNRKSLTVNLIGTIEKERDGTTQASIANENLELTGLIGIDDVSVLNPGAGSYASALPGTGIQVTVTGLSITGSDAGNYTLSSTSAAANVGIIVDKTPPAGYSVSIDQNLINESNASAVSFTIAGAEIGATLNYSFTSSGGGTPVTGSGTITSANQQFTGIDIKGLAKGTITLSLTLTDPYNNVGQAVTATATKEAPTPTITSATYHGDTGALVVTGTDFLSNSTGADVDASKLTLVGEGGEIYTLTDTFGSEITSRTSFTLTLSPTDRLSLGTIFNKNGMASTGGTTYNLAAADNWLTAAELSNDMSDLTGNGVSVFNVLVPSITSATYNWSTGSLVVTGSWFVKAAGASNDIVATRFALTGEGGTTYTFTDTQNAEITNGTSFTLNLSATDQAAIKPILNKNGLSAIDATTYNLAAAEDWSAGTNPAVVIADLSGNSILVSNVNQTPTATPPISPTVEEDTAPVLISGMSVSDGEGDNQTLSFTITGGVLSLGTDGITFGDSGNGSANFTASGTLAEINTALAAATFAPTPDLFGTNAGGISFTANDGTSTSAVASATFDILGINDDPTFIGLPASITVVEDVSPSYLSNALSAGTFNDVDAGSNDVTLILTVSSGTLGFANPQGIISIIGNGTSVANLVGTVTNIESYLSTNTNVSYNPALNLNGVGAATLTVSANDGGNTGSGGGTNVSLGQIQIDITPVNDAPTVANPIPNQNATQGAAFNFQFANNTFADVDAGTTLTYSAQLSGGGALPAWLSFDSITRTFSGTPLNANVGTVSIDVIANDGNGGTVTDTFDIVVANVNDAPTVANPIPNQNATENIAFNFQFAANTFNDIDVGDVLTYSVQLTGGGALPTWLSFNSATRTFSGTPGNADSGVINLEVIAEDSGGETVTDSFTLTVAAVNDAPDITAPLTIAVLEDVAQILTGIAFTDVDAGSNPVLVTFNVASGILVAESGSGVTVDGSGTGALELTGSVADLNSFIADGELSFTTSLNSTTDVTLEIEINDNGNSGSGGAKTDAVNLTLTVTAVNDAPVNAVPGDQQVDQNAVLIFSLSKANQISISDVDAGGGTVEVSLSATNGVLTLAGVTGLTFTTGDGTADGSMTFRGSIANINTAISTLTFYPTSNYNGLASITITTSDLGLNGSGGAQTDSDMILITVNAINPVVTSVSSITTNGLYKIGEVISIQVRFDQNLTVDTDLGIPTLSLETGVSDALAAYTSGSGTNILTFQYTVQEGNSTADLDYTGTAALLLNGAKITNAEALDALLTLPAPGTVNSLSANSTLSIDGIRPTVNIVINDTALSVGESTTVTITFNEAVSGLDAGDFTVANGTLSGLSSADGGSTWSAIFTPNANVQDATNLITLDKTGVVDMAGNTGVGSTDSNNYAIDTSRPTASVVVADTQLISGETTQVTITFSEAVIGFTTADLTVSNGFLSALSSADGGITWTTTLTPSSGVEDATNVIELANVGVADLAGNTGTGTTTSNNYAIDTRRPTVTIVVSDTQLSVGETSPVTITFTEAVNGLALDDFTIQNGSLSGLSTSDGGITWTATLTPDSGVEDATNLITLDNTGYQDLAGNTGSGISNSNNYSVDTINPTGYSVSIVPDRINGVNQNDFSFNLVDGEIGTTYSYSISSSGGGTPVTGNGTVSNINQFIDGINVSTLPDGELTLIVTLTDPSGNVGAEESDTVEKLLPAILTISAITQADEAGTDGEFEVLTSNLFAANTSVTIVVSGTATNGTDYTTIGSSFVFPANTSSVIIPVSVIDDIDVEGNETVIIRLVETNNPLVSVGSPAEATVTITDNDVPSPLTITPTVNQNKVYGSAEPSFTFTASGFNPGDDISGIQGLLSRAPGEDAGAYAFALGNLDAGPNYTLILSPEDFFVNPATITIQVDKTLQKVYGASDPTFTYSASGFVAGEDASILTGALARFSGESVGNYAINQGNLDAGTNYTIAYTGADFAITLKTLVVTADANQTKVYGAAEPTFSYAVTGFENGDDASILTGALGRTSGENVGNYAINQGNLDAGTNYTIDFVASDFDIRSRTLSIMADPGQGKIFGTLDPIFTYTATNFGNGDDASILTGTLGRISGENVGNYAINQGSLSASANYTIAYTGADFAITLKTLVITANANQTKVYGAAEPTLSYAVTGFENGDDASILTGTLARVSGENVGNYAINQGTLSAGDNYTISYTEADFAITLKTLVVTADANQTKVYGAAEPIFTYTANGFENGDDASILTGTLSRASGENVGNYVINQGNLNAGDNYTIDYSGADFSITLKTLVVIAAQNQAKVYGEADPILTYTVSGFENGDDASILAGALERISGESVGNYAINQGALNAGDNYSINYTGADFAITLKTLVVTADANQNKVYGAADPIFSYAVTGFENGDDASILTGALARASGENVGNYAINQGNLDAGANYTIAYTGADFAITLKTLVVTADANQTKVYGAADPIFSYAVTGFENGDDASILTGALTRVSGENVGSYAINQGNLDAGENYSINYTGADFAITLKTLVVTADANQTKAYGASDPIFTYTANGFENGDDASILTGALTRASGENVGNYAINQGNLDAGTNYTIDFVASGFDIRSRNLSIMADPGQGKIFGALDPIFTYTATNFANGDDASILTGTLGRISGENVGNYAINQGNLDAGANYTIAYTGADFAITLKTLVVTADANQNKVYGAADPIFSYAVTGFENGDDASILTGALTRDSGENVGNYAINQGNLDAGANYTIAYTGADFVITLKTLVVTADANQTKAYGASDPIFTYTANGFENGDDASILTGALARASGENVGNYAINQGNLDAGANYTIAYTGADFAITLKTLVVTADANQTKVYAAADPIFSYAVTGFENGDDASILTGALARISGENVGNYAINQGNLDAGDNYTIAYTGAEFAITLKTLVVTADVNQTKVYGAADPIFSYAVSGFENGDDASILTGTLGRISGEKVGNYAINQGSLSASANYTIAYTGADFAITLKTLVVTADANQTKVYGAADPIFSYSANGFENGDDASILTGALTRVSGENVGSYAINQGNLDAGENYSINYTGADFAITLKTLVVTADANQTKAYGASDPIFTYTANGFENGDDASILTGALGRTSGENVGNYAINQGNLDAGDNYTLMYTGADFSITEKTLTITASPSQQKVYGQADPIFTYTASGFENGDDASILTGALARISGENVGNYAINQGNLDSGDNYTISYTGANFAITLKTVVVTADQGQTKVYGKTDPIFTYSLSGFENGEFVLAGALDRVPGENVGTYSIGLGTLDVGSNYTIDYIGSVFTIVKKALQVTAGTDQQKVYGESDPIFTYIVNGFENGDSASILTGALDRAAGQDVGSYAIGKGTLSAGANYTVDFATADFVITRKVLTITAGNKSKVYGDPNPVLTFTYSGLVSGETKVATEPGISTNATSGSNVGTYPITLTGGADQNYTITLVNGTLTIGQKDLVVAAEDKSKVYGETNPALTFTYSGLVNGDTKVNAEPSIGTTATQSSNVGAYQISLIGGADPNYAITLVNGTLTIGQKALTVTADDKSKVYGEANPILTFTYTGLVNGDTKAAVEPSISTTALQSSAVGNYPIALTQGEDQNYAITLVNGTLTIGQKALTVTADDKQKTYGETNPILTFTYTGLVNGDTKAAVEPNISTTALQSSAVGNYPIALTQGEDQNYAITLVNGTLIIGQKNLTIRADDKQKTYGEANPTLTFTYTGLVNGDTKAAVEPNISTTALQSSGVGTYAIALTGGSDENYSIILEAGSMTIGKKELTITAEDKSKVYGETNPALTIRYEGLANGDTKVETEPSISTLALLGSNAGTYPITLTGGADQNYAITMVDGTLTINQALLKIITDSKSKIFGNPDPALTFAASGFQLSDLEAMLTGVLTRLSGETVGVYAISQGSLSAGANYQIEFQGSDFEIIPAELAEFLTGDAVTTPWSVDPVLPQQVNVLTQDGQILSYGVTWDKSTLNLLKRGTYTVFGTVNLPAGVLNPSAQKAALQVIVLPKQALRDIALSNNLFIPNPTVFFQEIGYFTVIDEIDQIHTVELVPGAADNVYFEIKSDFLFWSSSEEAAGMTQFQILVRVTDRDGNVIEKSFTILRDRKNISEITIFKAFSPDGDGINDTWGIPDLKYFAGGTVQVFDRSGQRIFYTESPAVRWDGIFEGKEMPVGSYYWILESKETDELRRGVLTLLRK